MCRPIMSFDPSLSIFVFASSYQKLLAMEVPGVPGEKSVFFCSKPYSGLCWSLCFGFAKLGLP